MRGGKNSEWFFNETEFELPVSWVPQSDSPDPENPDVAIRFSSGAVGWVGKNDMPESSPGEWLWDFELNGEILHNGYADTRDQAQRIIEDLAPRYNRPITEP